MSVNTSAPILITGVGKRLGLALARHFLIQDIPVIGTYRTEYPELAELRLSGAHLYHCDFYQQDSVDALIKAVTSSFPRLRAVIHNASDWLPESCGLAPDDIMNKMMQVHVSVPYQLNLAFRDQLQNNTGELADIIHITDYVIEKGSQKHIAYAASKAALANLTLSFASLLAPEVKVNALAPALVLFNDHDTEEYKAKTFKKSLIPKEAGLQELVAAVNYLLESTFVTGRILHIDGGRHLK